MTATGVFRTTGSLNLRATPDITGDIVRSVVPATTLNALLISGSVVIEDGYRWRKIVTPQPYTNLWFAECRVTNDGKPFGEPLARVIDIIITDDPAPPPDTDVRPTPEELYNDGEWSWNSLDFTQAASWLVEIHLTGERNEYLLTFVVNRKGFSDPFIIVTGED